MPSIRKYNLDALNSSMVRSLVWEALESKWSRDGHYPVASSYRATYVDICMSIVELAIRKKIIANPPVPTVQPYMREISEKSRQMIGSVLWELVSQQILYIDLPQNTVTGNTNYAFDITEYGMHVLSEGKPIPHDPDGYLSYLKAEIPNIDDVIFSYIAESVHAYNHHLFLSATTAVGCASEKALLLLLEAYVPFLPSEQERQSFIKKTQGRFIKNQFEEFQKSLGGQKGRIDKELTDGIDIVISGIFELLRQNRNSTGHPTGKSLTKENVFASLQIFVTYCKRIYGLIDFFNKNRSAS